MTTPLTLKELVAVSQIQNLQDAIVATLTMLLPDLDVKSHPGKLDLNDVVDKDMFRAPALAVAITRQVEHDRLSQSRDVKVDIAIYVIVEDALIGVPPRMVKRDELGHAICDALTALLNNRSSSRWNYQAARLDFPCDVEAKPLFTSTAFENGTAFYAVTFTQTLYNLDLPWDADPEPNLAPPPHVSVTYVPPLLGGTP
jgi:hypothetical protein